MSRDQYKRAYAGDTPRAATVALALDAAVAKGLDVQGARFVKGQRLEIK